jgi:hypothetical protein
MKTPDSKLQRTNRWNRRKARKDGNHAQGGCVGGNPRYGKGGNGGWPDGRAHRNRLGEVASLCR